MKRIQISIVLALALLVCNSVPAAETPPAKKAAPGRPPAVPANVERRAVTIYSDGVRMAADLYLPKERKDGEKFPAIVLCAGTAGTKATTGNRLGPILVTNGFVVLAFDYRGWGESDSKLITLEKQPRPDAKGDVEVKARAVRWQMDFADQAMDIRAAISFVAGEASVNPERIGIWGSSYGGGLVIWTAGNDPRVKCMAAQVPGMGVRTPQAEKRAYEYLTKQSRGEVEPVPYETGKFTGKMERYTQMRVNSTKSLGYSPVASAEKITAPTILVVAENEELSSNENVERVRDSLIARKIPVLYHVLKGMTHYSVYNEGFDESTQLEVEWFSKYLK